MSKRDLSLSQNNKNDVPLDSLPKKTLCDIIASNMLQIAQLTNDNTALYSRNQELEKDKENYCLIIEENKKLIKDHEINIEKLIKENERLNDKILSMEEHIDNQDKRISSLEKSIQELQDKDDTLTIREGFVSLEKYIMLEIVGSKKKARSFYGVKDLFGSKQYESECKNFMAAYKITVDHINLISEMKEYGNKSAHARPVILKSEFENIALSYLSDDDDKDMTRDLLQYLELKSPYDMITGLWEIKKPY